MRNRIKLALLALASLATPRAAVAAEICGNGIDDAPANSYADEGCFSNWVMGQCPSALSCSIGGDIAPVTGAFVYQLPPDISPTVPFGPKFEFRRTYMSMYAPPATNYRTAMGPRWQNNFQSWLDRSGSPPSSTVIVHLPTGQDVKFTYSNTTGGFDYYTPQAGYDVKHLRQSTTSTFNWELRTLTGEKLVYNWSSPVGKLIEIHDTLATPNKIVIAYKTSGPTAGQIDTILDASGKKRFLFSYSSGLVSSVAYQTVSGGSWTTRVTLSFTYTSTNPTTVQIAGNTIQTNAYTSNYLTSITDGNSKKIIDVAYSTATAGKAMRATTGKGGVGYEYASSHAQCTGGTVHYFNLESDGSGNAKSCGTATCGTGYYCGGRTGAGGNDGLCYRAARCMQTTSPSEDLITTITAFTGCTGACAPVAQYSWDTTTLDLKGIKLADNNWKSFIRNTDGLPTTIIEGDSDDNASNGGGAISWLFYGDTNFPGRVTERRTKSIISTEGTNACDGGANTLGCKRTRFVWNTDGLLGSQQENGWQYDGASSKASFDYTTSFTYDTKGRTTQINGPLAGADDVTDLTYWTSSDVLKDGYPNEIKLKKDTSNFLITTLDEYDYFGNAKSRKDPDATFTCRTWDGNRNYVTQVREAMAAQTSCATTNAADLTTNFVRDTSLRLTQTTRPGGDCEHHEYDVYGRLEYIKRRDDCNAASTGDTERRYYSANGFNSKIEHLDPSSVAKERIVRSDFDGTQLSGWQNPVSPSYSRGFAYFSDAQLMEVVGENSIGKTEFVRDEQNRETTRKRHLDATGGNFDSWTLTYPTWPSGERTTATRYQTVTDEPGKITTSDYDDLGRKNRIVSPDSATTVYVHDAASRMVTTIETATGGATYTHAFTYDNLGRKLTEDYSDTLEECDAGSNQVEASYVYDSVSCPPGASCTKQQGRLAKAKTKLLCIAGGTGDASMLEQETYYAYDDAGRLVQEYIQDDDTTPRTATQSYAWDKNSNLQKVTAPSAAAMTNTLGGSSNSDANLITTIAREVSGSPTNLLTQINWAPFGPVISYAQANSIGSNALRAEITYNLAYRPTKIQYAASTDLRTTVDYTEDEKGRFTQKVYSNVHTAIQNNYLTYDWFDRITCDATVSGTCPFEGSTVRTNIRTDVGNPGTGYNNSNDRFAFFHYDPAFSSNGLHYNVSFVSGKDQIASVTDVATSSYTFDQRGNRTQEDEPVSTFDKRDYTYDQRRRVRTISGKWLRFGFPNTWRDYRITYAWDHRDRLVYRSYKDLTGGGESRTFYYWDFNDRLIEVKHTPLISDTSTYSIYNFYWLGLRPVAQWTTNFPAETTARYFMHADEANRVLEMHDWPASGDATVVWSYNPDAFGWDRPGITGPYQPLRLNNAIFDDGTFARKSDPTFIRTALLIDRGAHYDPMVAVSLQASGSWPNEHYTAGTHRPAEGRPTRCLRKCSPYMYCPDSELSLGSQGGHAIVLLPGGSGEWPPTGNCNDCIGWCFSEYQKSLDFCEGMQDANICQAGLHLFIACLNFCAFNCKRIGYLPPSVRNPALSMGLAP